MPVFAVVGAVCGFSAALLSMSGTRLNIWRQKRHSAYVEAKARGDTPSWATASFEWAAARSCGLVDLGAYEAAERGEGRGPRP